MLRKISIFNSAQARGGNCKVIGYSMEINAPVDAGRNFGAQEIQGRCERHNNSSTRYEIIDQGRSTIHFAHALSTFESPFAV